MRKIFEGNYKKLDNDVSFQILRTNPRLTTNTKLMYDGERLYMESYNANELLSINKYKHKRVYKSGLYNNDIKNFLIGVGASSYAVANKLDDTVIGNDFKNQFENMYWSGCEEVSSNLYSEEFGVIAPLYIRKKLPNYFVIFKIDGPSNINVDMSNSNMYKDILKKCKIIKSFDLREGTVIGDYLRNYTSQSVFEYDKSIYVNHSTNEIYYYGIDINTGLLTKKVENFKEELMLKDNTVIHDDDWITNGFYRNGLIFPYIINFEFLFNDTETNDYKFCRYFGMYCDDIDLYKVDDFDVNMLPVNSNCVYYIKDKHDELYTLNKYFIFEKDNSSGTKKESYFFSDKKINMENISSEELFDKIKIDSNCIFKCNQKSNIITTTNLSSIDEIGICDYSIITYKDKLYLENLCVVMCKIPQNAEIFKNDYRPIQNHNITEGKFNGYYNDSISLYCDYVDGLGYASYMFSIEHKLTHGETISLYYGNDMSFNFIAEEYVEEKIDSIPYNDIRDISKVISLIENNNTRYLHGEVVYGRYSSGVFNRIYDISEIKEGNVYIKITDELYIQVHNYKRYLNFKECYLTIEKDEIAVYIDNVNYVGNIISNRFSCNGENSDIAKSLCECINNTHNIPFKAYNVGNNVVIKSNSSGSNYNNICRIEFSNSIISNNKVKTYSFYDDKFSGGTDEEGCIFRVHIDDIIQLIGENNDRYIKTPGSFENAKIISYSYYIDEFGDVDFDDFIITTDKNGKNIRISDVKQIEIVDKYYPTIGMLSFFPVKDFDFDTIYSSYCDNDSFKLEVKNFAKMMKDDKSKNDVEQLYIDNLSFDRIYSSGGNSLYSEYEYYNENLLPSLCTISKTAPYISKWGYVDGVDSCENPYRLNCNKIFGVNNFSSNLFISDGSLSNYTHEMPYYIFDDSQKIDDYINQNQYQYVYHGNSVNNNYSECLEYWKNLFENEEFNVFEDVFEVRTNKSNRGKRNCNKYSIFKFGSDLKNAETLFRGVKFEAINLVDDYEKYYDIGTKSYLYKNVHSEKYSSMFNDYKFSFIIIPVREPRTLYFNNKVYFIKNDKFKFIVGFVICNIFDSNTFNKAYLYGGSLGLISGTNVSIDVSGFEIEKNIIDYIYENDGKLINLSKKDYIDILNAIKEGNIDSSIKLIDDGNEIDVNIIDIMYKLKICRYCTLRMNLDDAFACNRYGNDIYISEMKILSPIIRSIIVSLNKKFGNCYINKLIIETSDFNNSETISTYVSYDKRDLKINDNYSRIIVDNSLKGSKITKNYEEESIYVTIEFGVDISPNYSLLEYPVYENNPFKDKVEDKDEVTSSIFIYNNNTGNHDDIVQFQSEDISSCIYSNIYNMYNNISAYYIKENINKNYNVEYNSDDFKIKIVEPESVISYDIFEDKIISSGLANNRVIENVGIGMKENIGEIGIKQLNRYSGYYQPIFNDILFYNDLEYTDRKTNDKKIYKFTNTSFDTEYSDNKGSFGVIRNMFFHKINDENIQILKSLNPYYPLIGEYALDYKDYNIFSSNWDSNYYTKQKDIYTTEKLDYIACIENGLYMFGSKYMNVPNIIKIDKFNSYSEWNDSYILNYNGECEIMYKEVNSKSVDFCLFLKNRIIRYFCELEYIRKEFEKYINKEKSYGLKNTLDDDIIEYVNRNILKLYEISEIKMFTKKKKRGINDKDIENDYILYLNNDENELLKFGFKECDKITINNIGLDSFTKKISYTLSPGVQEYFGFSFKIQKK